MGRYAIEARRPYYAGNVYQYVCRSGTAGPIALGDHPDTWEAKEEADRAVQLAVEQYSLQGYRFRVREATRVRAHLAGK